VASTGTPESESFANATKDAERIRKQMQTQHAEFEISKKSLVKDLQNRCEKASWVQYSYKGKI
jgi:kinesin family protein 5